MFYVTQGTIQVQVNLKDERECLVVLNPDSEYTVTHRGKKYMVSMPVPKSMKSDSKAGKLREAAEPDSQAGKLGEALVCLISEPGPYIIELPSDGQNSDVLEMLKGAALQRSKVELKLVKINDHRLELIGIKVPAPPASDSAARR
jgi:hypothetical protein